MHPRCSIQLTCLVAWRAFAADAAESRGQPVTPPETCGDVKINPLQNEQLDLMFKNMENMEPGKSRPPPPPSAAAMKARHLCDEACTGGDLDACVTLGDLLAYELGGPRDQKRAASLFAAGCDKGHARSCLSLAMAYAFGHGVPEDHDRKVELYQKACKLGDKEACSFAGAVEKSSAKEAARRRALARMSPAERDGATCTEPGPWTARRQAICERACKGRQPKACLALSVVYEGEYGVTADVSKSIAYARKACKLGDERGCTTAEAMEESRRNGGRGFGILGGLRAPQPETAPARSDKP